MVMVMRESDRVISFATTQSLSSNRSPHLTHQFGHLSIDGHQCLHERVC